MRTRVNNLVGGATPESSGDPAIHATALEWFARRDAGLTPAQQDAFEQWLAADPRHGEMMASLDSAWTLFGKPTRTGGQAELLQELAQRRTHRRRRRALGASVAMAALLVVGGWWRFPGTNEPSPAPRTASVHVPVRKLLADGSLVVLKEGAQIAEAFSADSRRVTLKQGEALFEVAPDPERAFIVSARGVEVRAVGTAFSVHLGSNEVEVLVTEGKITVHPKAGTSTGEASAAGRERSAQATTGAAIAAGHRVLVDITADGAAPRVMPVPAIELDERLAWRNPRVEFSGTPLHEAVALMNEAAVRTGIRLVVADPALESTRVSGIFRADNIDVFVLLLEEGFGVKAERAEKRIILRRGPTEASP